MVTYTPGGFLPNTSLSEWHMKNTWFLWTPEPESLIPYHPRRFHGFARLACQSRSRALFTKRHKEHMIEGGELARLRQLSSLLSQTTCTLVSRVVKPDGDEPMVLHLSGCKPCACPLLILYYYYYYYYFIYFYLFLFFYFSGARQWDSLYDITHGLVSFSRFTSSLSTAVPLQRLFSQSLWPVACEFLSVFVVISTSTLAQWTSAQQKSRTVATFIVHACGRPSARQHRSYGFQIHVQGFTFFMLSTTLMKHSVFILFYFIFI